MVSTRFNNLEKHAKKKMNDRFSGKLVLVAGGTGGLGRAVSLAFLAEGARVIVTYRDQKEFDVLKRSAGANASVLQGRQVDMTNVGAVDEFVGKVLSEHGQLDVVVNAVGGYAGGLRLWESDPKVFDQMLALNLQSGYAISRAVVPAMLKN